MITQQVICVKVSMKLTSCDVYTCANPENAYFLFYTNLMKAYDYHKYLVREKQYLQKSQKTLDNRGKLKS